MIVCWTLRIKNIADNRELEVEHPAAKLMILGSQMQEVEVGDATNFVIIFAGALLKEAEDLLRCRQICKLVFGPNAW
jgi:T-complex protein 1 subunit theta